jgi:CxxC-x17-CxxC domain-containing protein
MAGRPEARPNAAPPWREAAPSREGDRRRGVVQSGAEGPAARPTRARPQVYEAPAELRPRKRREDAPKPAAAAQPRPAKKKAERPKFDVTCVTCGAAAQVPFKPIEGRDIFCQPCYRARAPVATAPAPAASTPAPDVEVVD